MILSYHPLFPADENRLCAGRDPAAADRAAMAAADAVILPQGCRPALWAMAAEVCPLTFPDYRVRFGYPGKCGQIRLFREYGVKHPASAIFPGPQALLGDGYSQELHFPMVFKFDWGGEGEGVHRVAQADDLKPLLARAAVGGPGERSFLLQELIPCGNRSLRVAVIGQRLISYWRVASAGEFQASLARGSRIDRRGAPRLQKAARDAVVNFCNATGINLAGFDLLFDECQGKDAPPLLLEINWFFGREGLGGSPRFYRLLRGEINSWLAGNGLALRKKFAINRRHPMDESGQ